MMGYRSYGGFVFPSSQLQMYEEMCPLTPLSDWEDTYKIDLKYKQLWYDDQYFRDNPELLHLFFSGWKWYESYPSIKQIEAFQEYLTDNAHPWFFYRKGEGSGDDHDIDTQGPDEILFGGLKLGNRINMLDLESGLEIEEYIDSLFESGEYDSDEEVHLIEMVVEKEPSMSDKEWLNNTQELKAHLDSYDTEVKWEINIHKPAEPELRASLDLGWHDIRSKAGAIIDIIMKNIDNLFGEDAKAHIYQIWKESGGFFQITSLRGADPWEFDIHSSVGIGWNWKPELAAPPQAINKRRVI